MKWSKLLIGFCAGMVAGTFINQKVKQDTISSETALSLVKKAFNKEGAIDGSWIHMHTENITKFNLPYKVYRGGITRTVEGKVEQYEFLVDATTGTILEVNPL